MFVLSEIISVNSKDSDKSREAPKNTGGSGCRTFEKKRRLNTVNPECKNLEWIARQMYGPCEIPLFL